MYGILKVCPICGKEEFDGYEHGVYMKFDTICPVCAEKLKELINKADVETSKENADGCDGCKYIHKDMNEMPCVICKNRYMNQWTECSKDECCERVVE